jgi:hypothetical protein
MTDQQPFLGEALHGLAQRAAADAQFFGQFGFSELDARSEVTAGNSVADFAGDYGRSGLLYDRV